MLPNLTRLVVRAGTSRARPLGDSGSQYRKQFYEQHRDESHSDNQKEKEPGRSGSNCPFVLAVKQFSECLGVIGASWIVGSRLVPPSLKYSEYKKTERKNISSIPSSHRFYHIFVRDHRWAYPVYFVRASPVGPLSIASGSLAEKQVSSSSPNLTSSNEDSSSVSSSSLTKILSGFKKEFTKMAIDYTDSIKNQLGIALLEGGHEKEGMKLLLANDNCTRTCYNIAVAYETGRYSTGTVEPNLNLAFEYYLRAARSGHKRATYNLALFYLYGKGPVKQDAMKGVQLLKRAHELGVEQASIYTQFLPAAEEKKPQKTSSAPNLQLLLSNLLSVKKSTNDAKTTNNAIDKKIETSSIGVCVS